jgi:multiple sugar transport system permease protein
MVLPTLIIVLLIAAGPIAYAIYLSLWRILPGQWTFVGLGNYATLFSDPEFYTALFNTAVFTIASVAGEFALGLTIALVLNRGWLAPSRSCRGPFPPWCRESCGA